MQAKGIMLWFTPYLTNNWLSQCDNVYCIAKVIYLLHHMGCWCYKRLHFNLAVMVFKTFQYCVITQIMKNKCWAYSPNTHGAWSEGLHLLSFSLPYQSYYSSWLYFHYIPGMFLCVPISTDHLCVNNDTKRNAAIYQLVTHLHMSISVQYNYKAIITHVAVS